LKAAYTGQYTVVDYLISQAGADYTMADRDGWTALHNACSAGHVGLVQLLVYLPNTIVDIQSAQGHTPLSK
jgi:ankyrin repeat protein